MKTIRPAWLAWLATFAAAALLTQLTIAAKKAPPRAPEPVIMPERPNLSDPKWKPLFEEIQVMELGRGRGGGKVLNYCLDRDGKLLVCRRGGSPSGRKDGEPAAGSTPERAEVAVFSPSGECLETWEQPCTLQAICVSPNGHIFAGGSGRVLRLDAEGRVVASVPTPVATVPVAITKQIEGMLREQNRFNPAELEKMKQTLERRRGDVPGIAATDHDVFVVCPTPNEFTYRVYRFDHDLQRGTLVLEKLRGCCGQMDIQAHDSRLWVAHNGRHRVEVYDRDGKLLSHFGKAGRTRPEDFGGCCEPKNLRITPNGEVLAAESGPPSCIKRFTPDGKFVGVLAIATSMNGDCVRMTVAASPDGSRLYLLDTAKDVIRVFGRKG